MIIKTRRLGLAAYIKMSGCNLIKFENRTFFFDSEQTADDWEILYSNSCCAKHDLELCELRKLIK